MALAARRMSRAAYAATGSAVIAFRAATAAAANTNSLNVTIPVTVQAGDMIVLAIGWSIASGQTLTPLSGWTAVANAVSDETQVASQVFYKRANSGDAGSVVTIGLSAIGNMAATVTAYSGVSSTDTIAAWAGVAEGGSDVSAHTTPAVTIPTTGDWLVSVMVDKGKTVATTSWSQPAGDILRTAAYNTGTSGVTIGVSDAGTGSGAGASGGKIWQSDAATSRAIMWSIVLHPGASEDTPAPPILLGHWDESPLRMAVAGWTSQTNHNYWANKGVGLAMGEVLGTPGTTVGQIQKSYPSSWQTNYSTSEVRQSAEFGHAFMINFPPPGTWAAVTAGTYDTQIAAWFNSIPDTETAYTCLQNEPDNWNTLHIDPADFCPALGRVINIGAPIMRARGLKGGIGTVLTGYFAKYGGTAGSPYEGKTGADYFDAWNYIQYVDPANLGQVVYMIDCYSKYTPATNPGVSGATNATPYESIPDIAEALFTPARAAGCARFGIGEFGNSRLVRNHAGWGEVGTTATQEHWLQVEIPKIRAIPGMEFAIYFHKPTGTESQYDQLLDDGVGTPFTRFARQIMGE